MVDGELLFFFAQLFPDTLRLGDVLFGELQDVVVVVPEEAELFVAGFFLLELSAGSRNGHIYPAIIIDDADVQGSGILVWDDFDHSFSLQMLYETVSSARRPMQDDAPAAVAVQAFASLAHYDVVPVVGVLRF